jgi:uncharacterized membrane-anchored protein
MTGSRLSLIVGAVLVLGAINFSIAGKEAIKRDGQVVFLDLAPLDPRSLMQGDYMALRFRLAQEIERSMTSSGSRPRDGEQRLAPVTLDPRRVASLAKPGAASALTIRYRMRKDAVWLGTNAFFFEEGSEERYARARYGEFRVDASTGEAVLVGLRDATLKPL